MSAALLVMWFLGALAVLQLTQKRHALVRRLYRKDVSQRWVWLTLAVIMAIVVFRLTVDQALFNPLERNYWSLLPLYTDQLPLALTSAALSWAHAMIIAALIFWTAKNSISQPLGSAGERTVIGLLIFGAATTQILDFVERSSYMMMAATHSAVFQVELSFLAPFVKLGVVAALIWLVAKKRFSPGVGHAMARVTVVAHLPVAIMFVAYGIFPDLRTPLFWATPHQVFICLVLLVFGQMALSLRKESLKPPYSMLLRLLLVPAVVLNVGALLPLAWTEPYTRALVIAAAAIALFLAMPPVASDRVRHTREVLIASASEAGILVAFTVMVLMESLYEVSPYLSQYGMLQGRIWLAVPLMVAFCCRFTQSNESLFPSTQNLQRKTRS